MTATEIPEKGSANVARAEKPERRSDEEAQLPSPGWRELTFYIASFALAFAYAAWDFYGAYGVEPSKALSAHYLKPGWLAQWMEKPAVWLEVSMLNHWRFLAAASIGFLFTSQLTLRLASRTTHYLTVAGYTLAVTATIVGIRSALYMLMLHVSAVCVAYFSLTGVWLVVLSAMTLQTSSISHLLMNAINLSEYGIERDMHFPIIGYLFCRSISAGHSLNRMLQHQRMKESGVPTFAQFVRHHFPKSLAYGFYFPWHFCGPILTFDDFCKEVERSDRTFWNLRSATVVTWRAFRIVLWLFVLQWLHHFLPVGAFLQSLTPHASLAYSRLVLSMYLYGQNFMLLYVQLYGWAGLVARLDGVRLLDWPDCISRIYTYTKMWRVFDRGLASFMHNHIYIPMGGSRHGIPRQVAAVAACFAFVSVYHGDTWAIRLWAAVNAAQLLLETAINAAYRMRVKRWMGVNFNPILTQRLVAFVISVSLYFSSCSIFVFFYGTGSKTILLEVWKPFYLRKPFWYHLVVQYLCYCSVQISFFYERRVADKQRID